MMTRQRIEKMSPKKDTFFCTTIAFVQLGCVLFSHMFLVYVLVHVYIILILQMNMYGLGTRSKWQQSEDWQ